MKMKPLKLVISNTNDDITLSKQVVGFAVSTRMILLFIQTISNAVVPDHEPDIFSPPRDTLDFTWPDHVVHFLFGGFRRWDAVYFTHIAEYGYTYENCVAFFPLFPLLVSCVATMLHWLLMGWLHMSSSVLVASLLLNLFLFTLTALALFKLTLKVLGDIQVAFISAVFFCLNPASIFMSSPYSETLFFFLLVYGLLGIEARAFYASSFLFSLSILTRSNGLVTIGFILHALVFQSFRYLKPILRDLRIKPFKSYSFFQCTSQVFLSLVPKAIVCVVICLSSFLGYQYYVYLRFCCSTEVHKHSLPSNILSYGLSRGYKIQGDSPSSWCNETIPFSYSYIQKQHWGVGFLSYYKLKQIPNFILAFPVILLSFLSCRHFAMKCGKTFYFLGLLDHSVVSELLDGTRKPRKTSSSDDESREDGRNNFANTHDPRPLVVFVIHLGALTLFGCCFVHIQVLTRMLFSSSPLLYWYPAMLYSHHTNHTTNPFNRHRRLHVDLTQTALIADDPKSERTFPSRWFQGVLEMLKTWYYLRPLVDLLQCWEGSPPTYKAIVVYFLSYFIVGTLMFSNSLPWT